MEKATISSPVTKKVPTLPEGVKNYLDEKEYKKRQLAEAKREAGRLIRCRITCMNPHKKNWTGEIISVGSSKMGTFKKFIPFNIDEPYHVPKAIYDFLKERKCRIGVTHKLANGQQINKYKLINEFAVESLPPLTKEELEDLKNQQAAVKGVG